MISRVAGGFATVPDHSGALHYARRHGVKHGDVQHAI
jgi:hypothetical protein